MSEERFDMKITAIVINSKGVNTVDIPLMIRDMSGARVNKTIKVLSEALLKIADEPTN